jgi:hypothetical protein
MGITTIPNAFVFKPTTKPISRWMGLSYSAYDLGGMAVKLGGIRLRGMKKAKNSISFDWPDEKGNDEADHKVNKKTNKIPTSPSSMILTFLSALACTVRNP